MDVKWDGPEARHLPALNLTVEPGQVAEDVPEDVALGLAGQEGWTLPDGEPIPVPVEQDEAPDTPAEQGDETPNEGEQGEPGGDDEQEGESA